jgi:hypothetical protein
MKVVGLAMDGGAPERSAQEHLTQHHLASGGPCLEAQAAPFGITLRAPIVDGHPLIVIQDPEHARKTFRNNLSSGARLLCLGQCLAAYEILLRLLGYDATGLTHTDLLWVDKQDDGAALRLFHSRALAALVVDGEIRPGMDGVFVVLFVFGKCLLCRLVHELVS